MEAGALRVVLTFCLALMVAPVAAASPEPKHGGGFDLPAFGPAESPQHHRASEGDRGSGERRDGDHGQDGEAGNGRGREGTDPGPHQEEESIELAVQPEDAGNRLDWVFHGKGERVKTFDIYRSINAEPAQRIASVFSQDKAFLDQDRSQSGAYSYFVVANHNNGMQTTSNQQSAFIVLVSCNWLSVSPFGNPPVLFNPECNPLGL